MAIFLKAAENHALISGGILNFLFLFRIPDAFFCYLGIIPYLYVKSFFEKGQQLSRKPHLHLLWPFIFIALELMLLTSDKMKLLDLYYIGFQDANIRFIVMAQAILCIGYSVATYGTIHNYKRKVCNHVSNLDSLKLKQFFLINSAFCLFFIFTFSFLLLNFKIFHPLEYSLYTNIFFFFASILLIAVAAHALKPQITTTELKEFEDETQPLAEKKFNADKKKINGYKDKIETAVLGHKLYLNPELKLQDLSEATRIPSYLLSYAINHIYQKTFNDLINDLRINEFQYLAADEENKNVTILALSMESGFNSKSNFNNQFKKRVNMTPKAYRDSLSL